jgi:hypothetical protein
MISFDMNGGDGTIHCDLSVFSTAKFLQRVTVCQTKMVLVMVDPLVPLIDRNGGADEETSVKKSRHSF